MTLKSTLAAAATLGLSLGLIGAAAYFFGNQPGIKQAVMGLNGAVSPKAPPALF